MASWLADYLTYTQTQESPERFHLWCGISLIAATLNHKVWLPRISGDGIERFRTFPGRMGVVLVAGSGKAKKSTAIADMAQSILREAGTATIYDGMITPERLMGKLGSQPSGKAIMTLIQHEMTTFVSKKSYQEHIIDILTKLMDGKEDGYETQQKTYKLHDVCVTQLYGTTPRNLGENVPPQAHDTGFMGRYLFVYGDRSGKIEPLSGRNNSDPTIATESIRQRHSLIQRLRDISKIAGPISWTTEGKEWFDDWYERYMNSDESEGEGWPQRKPEHLLRVAIILSIAREMSLIGIGAGDQQAALTMLEEHIERDMVKSFAYIGRHASVEAQQRIIDVLKLKGGKISSKELYARTLRYFGDHRSLAIAIQGMQIAGSVKCFRDSQGDEWWSLEKELY